MRDHKKYKVFGLARGLVSEVYRRTKLFPAEERYGLQSQIRRASVSVPTNIVEGCARTSEKEFLQFLSISLGSANETAFLVDLSCELEMLSEADRALLAQGYEDVSRQLAGLIQNIRNEGRE